MKKIICLTLAVIIVALSVFSCAENKKTPDNNNTGNTDGGTQAASNENATQTETIIIEAKILSDLPEKDFEGTEFRILLSAWSEMDFDREEITGEPLDDAVYNRNRKIEEKYNVVLKMLNFDPYDTYGTSDGRYRKAVKSGEDAYDVYLGIQRNSTEDTMNGYNVEWQALPYMDLNKPWWDSGILDVQFGGKVYYATGHISHSALGYTPLLLFNKNLFSDSGIKYPYEDVIAGKWTWDRFTEVIKDMSRDLNGDGIMKPEDDLYSVSGWRHEIPYNFYTALGGNEIIKNAEGYPEIAALSEKSIEAAQRVVRLFTEYGAYYNTKNYGDDLNMFKNRRLYFLDARLVDASKFLRDMPDDFGMIPHPKPDESTPDYKQGIKGSVVTVVSVPITNTKLEMTSVLLEDFAYEGWKEITPQYQEVLLRTKLTRDDESADMFDYIWQHKTYAYGLVAYGGKVLMDIISGKDENKIVSAYEKLQPKAEKEIEDIKNIFFSN